MTEPKVTGPLCIFYGTIDDIEVVINLPGDRETHAGRPRVPKSLLDHLKAIPEKVKNINSLDGLPAVLKKIEMTGKNHVEKVKVTYQQGEQEIVRSYAPDQFYKL